MDFPLPSTCIVYQGDGYVNSCMGCVSFSSRFFSRYSVFFPAHKPPPPIGADHPPHRRQRPRPFIPTHSQGVSGKGEITIIARILSGVLFVGEGRRRLTGPGDSDIIVCKDPQRRFRGQNTVSGALRPAIGRALTQGQEKRTTRAETESPDETGGKTQPCDPSLPNSAPIT